jgi:DNA-binding transcriptional ArsR family regulator
MPEDTALPRGADIDMRDMSRSAKRASDFLKALAHEGRLMILCHLVEGERTVGELEQLLGARQPAVSQQLARLRLEGLVATRREGKTIFYRLGDDRVARLLESLHALVCPDEAET